MRIASTMALAICTASATVAQADATLVYGLTGANGQVVEKKLSVSRFFVRADASDQADDYLLFQAGKFFPLYRVKPADGTYTRLTPRVEPTLHAGTSAKPPTTTSTGAGPGTTAPGEHAGSGEASAASHGVAAEGGTDPAPAAQTAAGNHASGEHIEVAESSAPSASSAALPVTPKFKPTSRLDSVASIKCRIIVELIDDKPAVEHCMANKAALGITERETRTLARLFAIARKRGYDWLGTASTDEDFISVSSRDLRRERTLTLKSLSTATLPAGYLRVPRDFKEVTAAAPMDAVNAVDAVDAANAAEAVEDDAAPVAQD